MKNNCQDENVFSGHLCDHCRSCKGMKSILTHTDMDWEEWVEHTLIAFIKEKERRRQKKEDIEFLILGRRPHKFVTLNFSVETTIDELHEIVHKLKIWDIQYLKGSKFVIEYNGSNNNHPHIHLLILEKVKQERLLRDFSKKFKLKSNFIDIVNRADLYQIHRDYVTGQKVPKEKKKLVKLDKIWRKKYNFIDVYHHVP